MIVRNTNLDVLKVILAFLVVAGHLIPTSEIESKTGLFYYFCNGFLRILIPIFYMISGYFLKKHFANKEYLTKYGLRIFKIFVVWQIIYLPIIINLYLKNQVDFGSLLNNIVYGTGHLWYLIAMVEATILIYLTRNLNPKNKTILAFSVLVIGYVVQFCLATNTIQNKSFILANTVIGSTRNFLFFAFPFMLLGTVYEYWKNFVYKYKLLFIPLLVVLFIEIHFYYNLNLIPLNILVVTMPLSLIVVCCAIEMKSIFNVKVNSSLSLGIYLCHFYPIYYFIITVPQNGLEYVLYKYILVCITTVVMWFILDRINRKIPIFF